MLLNILAANKSWQNLYNTVLQKEACNQLILYQEKHIVHSQTWVHFMLKVFHNFSLSNFESNTHCIYSLRD